METSTIITGVDQIGQFQEVLRYENIGLLTTGTALNRWMVPTLQSVNDRLHLTALFGLEYGIQGEKRRGERYESYTDVWTGLPVFSLYRYGAFHFSQEMLARFDILLVDLPLTGTRYDTYIPAIHRLLRELGENGKKVIILDRPNPLGGVEVSGGILQKVLQEDEDAFPLPIRHGLTLGEIALLMNSEDQLGCDVEVIKVKNWERRQAHPEMNRPWIYPQPHLPTFNSCLLSVGIELLGASNVSIGHGTPKPYQNIGAPFLDAIQLSASLNKRNISGLLFHPIYFTPTVDLYQGELCQGVQVHVVDRNKVQPLYFALELIAEIKTRAGDDFRFVSLPDGKYPIDYLFGNNRLRRQPEEYQVILADCDKEAALFSEKSQAYHLYG